MPVRRLPYKTYVQEREHLSKYEQTNYDNYEKAILTLSSAFLAFSLAFLGLFPKPTDPTVPREPLAWQPLLILSWLLFALSVVAILATSFVGAMAIRLEVKKLGAALKDVSVLKRPNAWTTTSYALYVCAGLFFVEGILALLLFCGFNLRRF